MRNFFSKLRSDRTIKSTTVMVGGSALANVGAYLFHLLMGRMLVPADYGAIQSLISLSNILNVPLVTLNTVITKFVSTYVGKGELHSISSLYVKVRRVCLYTLVVGGIIFMFFAPLIINFLHLDSWILVFILDVGLFFGLLSTLNRSILQGLSLFIAFSITQTIEAYGKLLFGVVAVYLGFRVVGAYGAFVGITFISYGYMAWVLSKKLPPPNPAYTLPRRAMIRYAVPSFIATVSVASMYNTDVVLVRHFLTAQESGIYAALSILGKMIFFGSAPVTMTMFPLVSEAHAKGDRYVRIFLLSLLFIIGIAGITTGIFSLFPRESIRLLIGGQYEKATTLLPYFSFFLSLCAIVNLFVQYFLSIHRTKVVGIVLLGALVQAVGIILYHGSLITIISISLWVTAILTAVLALYFIYTHLTAGLQLS